jgi:hypothetical protein
VAPIHRQKTHRTQKSLLGIWQWHSRKTRSLGRYHLKKKLVNQPPFSNPSTPLLKFRVASHRMVYKIVRI